MQENKRGRGEAGSSPLHHLINLSAVSMTSMSVLDLLEKNAQTKGFFYLFISFLHWRRGSPLGSQYIDPRNRILRLVTKVPEIAYPEIVHLGRG